MDSSGSFRAAYLGGRFAHHWAWAASVARSFYLATGRPVFYTLDSFKSTYRTLQRSFREGPHSAWRTCFVSLC